MSEGKEAITLLHHLKGKERDKIKVFKVEELSWPDMKKEIVEVFKRGSEESSRA